MQKRNVSIVLRELLDRDRISPTELHRRTGVPQSTLSRILSGKIVDPSDKHISRIADYFQVSTDQLRGRAGLVSARAGQTRPSDLAGGTITITNIGVFGVDAGTPILNPGEAAILAMGAIRTLPWEHNNTVALRRVMTLTLTFDHRLVDGEQAARFLTDVGAILANPGAALTMV